MILKKQSLQAESGASQPFPMIGHSNKLKTSYRTIWECDFADIELLEKSAMATGGNYVDLQSDGSSRDRPPLDVPHEEPSKLTGQVVLIFGPSQYADALDHRDN
jgi:hypothetical protein